MKCQGYQETYCEICGVETSCLNAAGWCEECTESENQELE